MIKQRNTLYLSPIRDSDIISYVSPLLYHYDFSQIIRDLVRDGIKYRKGEITKKTETVSIQSHTSPIIQESNTTPKPSLKHIKLEKVEVNDKDLEDRLDSF